MKQATKLVAVITSILCLGHIFVAQAADRPTSTGNKTFLELVSAERNTQIMRKTVKYLISQTNATPYVPTGDSSHGWDCSGMTRWAYKRIGITIPHSANKQAHIGVRVSDPAVGDLVAFAYPNHTDFYHVGLYIGKGKIINANKYYGTTVIESLAAYKHQQIRFIHLAPMVKKASITTQ
jgi:cell wall-associated NlpC family hydrolase